VLACFVQAWLFSLIAGIVMLFVDAVLVILRLTQLDKQEAKRAKDEARRPLGVRLGTKSKPQPQRFKQQHLPAADSSDDVIAPPSPFTQRQLPPESQDDPLASLAAAQRAFDRLSGSSNSGEPATVPPSVPVEPVELEEKVGSQSGIRRRARKQ
jgi:hypothetical protein